jgi:hypothetical protein
MMLTTEYCDIQAVTDYTQAGAGVAGVLNGAKIVFGINPSPPPATKTRALADITQSVDAGLAPAAVTWGAAGRDSAGDIVTLTASLPVKITVNANNCTITCWGLEDAGGTHLLIYEVLPTPMNLPDTLALFNVQIPFAPANSEGKTLQITS